jgi:hypothetical protein
MKDSSSPVVDREPHVEQLKADGRHEKEVHPGDHVPVIAQEGDLALLGIRIGLRLRQIARDRRETHLDPELRQFGSDLPESLAMPADHSLRLHDEERASPSRPKARNGDPEDAIQGQKTWSWMSMGVNGEVMSQRELDDRLVLVTPEEGEDAPKDGDHASRCGRHRGSDSARVGGSKGV